MLTIVAVSLLIAAAVASLCFPPVAIALAGAGLLLFASVTISNALSSPPVRAKMSALASGTKYWFKAMVGRKDSGYKSVATNEQNPPAVANEIGVGAISPLHPQKPAVYAESFSVTGVANQVKEIL